QKNKKKKKKQKKTNPPKENKKNRVKKSVKDQRRGLTKLLEQNDFQGFADKLTTTLAGIPNEEMV
ncbi:MAG: hypothetical protein OXC40_02940, partial [Proteobacteria bacterium]|nr:hypothetical protein [Pseudomonadota bacterium]